MTNLETIAIVPELLAGVWWDIDDAITGRGNARTCSPRHQPTVGRACLLIAPTLADGYIKAREEAMAPFLPEIRAAKGITPEGIARRVRGAIAAKAHLKGWSGIELGGEVLTYSEDAAVRLLSDPRFEILLRLVENAAASEQALIAQEQEEASGN